MSGISLKIEEAAQAAGGRVVRGKGTTFSGVCTDSRTIQPGELFVALAGDKFDGHEFLTKAGAAGAAAVMVDRTDLGDLSKQVAVIQVMNTRFGLMNLAKFWRKKVAPKVVAITGSVGKTTTRELTAAIMRQVGRTHTSPKNFNNDVGLPITICQMPVDTQFLVAELGMNAAGEIASLTKIAQPDVGLITAVAPVHLEGLGTLENIAAAKGELFEGLSPEAWAVFPSHEKLLNPYVEKISPSRRLRFGAADGDDVRIVEVKSLGERGSFVSLEIRGQLTQFELPLPGAHNVQNAAAAAAAALALGATPAQISSALSQPVKLEHRSTLRTVGGYRIFDDCYNANPVAMRAALQTLMEMAPTGTPTVAVLGEMRELGENAQKYHQEVGEYAAKIGLTLLVTVGDAGEEMANAAKGVGMAAEKIVAVRTAQEAAASVTERMGAGTMILIKASRGAQLEQVIEELIKRSPK